MTPTFLPGTGLFLANKRLQDDSGCPKFRVGNCQISLVSIKNQPPQQVLGLPPLTTTTLGTLIPMDKGPVHLFGTAAFLTSQPDAAQESLFVLNIHINLDTQFSIQEEKLWCSLALDRELLVKGFLVNIIEAAYVPAINGALQEGIPLPNLLGIKYEHADIRMSE
ncbi:unnamed protein product, partial [Eretmochelys imbricata]